MENKLTKKYGLITAIAMVVGIVIGSGVFFKAEKILNVTDGNMTLGILAWVIGGLVMLACVYTFSILATKYTKVNGVVAYAEMMVGGKYAYMVGWFISTIYLPAMTSVLAWVSARYIGVLFGLAMTGGDVMVLACFLLVASYTLNALSPILAGKFQVSTTVIKLIPLVLMAIVGTIVGLSNGVLVENFSKVTSENFSAFGGLMSAVCATSFAYEGWIIATTINSELKNAKRDLPLALILGGLIIIVIYVIYYIGLSGAVDTDVLMSDSQAGIMTAFSAVFSSVGGTILIVFVSISCLGTLNGLMLGNSRNMYSLAVRNRGPKQELFSEVDPQTNMPTNSAIIGLFISAIWLVFFYGANLADTLWFGDFGFDSSELPIITTYLVYIPIFIMMMVKEKELHPFKRFVAPALGLIACCIMITAAIVSHGAAIWDYLIVFAIVMGAGAFFMKPHAGTAETVAPTESEPAECEPAVVAE